MSDNVIQLHPSQLMGPRSFFTDLDPKDPTYNQEAVKLKFKLQFMTKEKVVVAASSLFTNIGYELFSSEQGLTNALNKGIVVPAIRNEFADPQDFFLNYEHVNCSATTRKFFEDNVAYSVPWDLEENSSWFKKTLYSHIQDPQSLLRQKTSMTDSMSQDFLALLDAQIEEGQSDYKYLRREHVYSVGKNFGEDISSYVSNFTNLIYRLSGSIVVKSESHFPQSNLTKLGLTDDDSIVSDESIFWDIYIETMISFLSSAIRLTPDRLNEMSVHDILKIRKTLIGGDFIEKYDKLIQLAKGDVDIHDPDKLILKQCEINAAARSLRSKFANRVLDELSGKDTAVRENSLWQLGNVLTLISMPAIATVVGVLSACKSIPEITALFSKSLSESLDHRYQWVRNFVNCKIGWSKKQKKTLLDGYRELITYGIPS